MSSLLNENKELFLKDKKEEYRELVEDYYEHRLQRKYVTLDVARRNPYQIDLEKICPKPLKLGITIMKNVDILEIRKYIDWNPFFFTWQLRGKYPNKGYPNIFNDKNVGIEAKKLFDQANEMIDKMNQEDIIKSNAIIGLFAANSRGDDIVIYKDDTRTEIIGTLYGLILVKWWDYFNKKKTEYPYSTTF